MALRALAKTPPEALQAHNGASMMQNAILDSSSPLDSITYKRWQLAKQTTWLTLLVVSFLIFYLLDILQQSIAIEMIRY